MKIESAQVAMQSTRIAFEQVEIRQRIERWNTPAPAATAGATDTGGAPSAEATAIAEGIEAANEDPRLVLLRQVIEWMTGKSVRLLRLDDIEGGAQTYSPPAREGTPRAAGQGMSLRIEASRSEYEYVGFAASGVVRTADGREIRFDVGFEMERSYAERISVEITSGAPRQLKDPLVLDFGGAGGLSDARFAFDLDADGETDAVPLLAGGRGFLAIDRDGNGRIDDGRELFGPTTGNGFGELAELDSDGNGWIDEADARFADLRLWRPDANGTGTLVTLAEAGVGALSLASLATPFALRGAGNDTLGVMRSSGVYLAEDGTAGSVSQIDLAV